MVSLYQIQNTVNGKLYFGKTRLTVEARWRKHCKDSCAGAQWALARAIRKYGPDSFIHTLLFIVPTESIANAAEITLIALHGTTHPARGYNLTAGGDGIARPSEELRARRYKAQLAGIYAPGAKRSSSRFGYGRVSPHCRKDISTEEIVRLYLDGNSPRKISKILGGFKSVRQRLRKAGVAIRKRSEVKLGRPCATC